MGYRVPNYTSDDSYALNVLESILSHGKSARALSEPRLRKNGLGRGSHYGLMQADPGLFYFLCRRKTGEKSKPSRTPLRKRSSASKQRTPTDLELQRAKNQIGRPGF